MPPYEAPNSTTWLSAVRSTRMPAVTIAMSSSRRRDTCLFCLRLDLIIWALQRLGFEAGSLGGAGLAD